MSEFLREVDEDLRSERLLSLWRRWRWLILSFVAALLIGVGGWEALTQFNASRQEQATATYRSALLVSDDAFEAWQEEREKEAEEAEKAKAAEAEAEAQAEQAEAGTEETETVAEATEEQEVGQEVEQEAGQEAGQESAETTEATAEEAESEEVPLTDAELRAELDLPDPFYDEDSLRELIALAQTDNKAVGTRTLARLQTAFRHYESERYDLADVAWLAVMADESAPLLYRDLAAVLRGYAMLDLREASDLRLSLEAVANRSDSAFHASASEALALVLIKEGDTFSARGYLAALADSTNDAEVTNPVPASLRSRANRLLSFIENEEDKSEDKLEDKSETEIEPEGETEP